MTFDLSTFLLPCVITAIILVVIGTEMIKKQDKDNKLKGYRIYIPLSLSAAASSILAFGQFYSWRQAPFYWAVIFGVSVFGYEGILKKFKKATGIDDKESKEYTKESPCTAAGENTGLPLTDSTDGSAGTEESSVNVQS